MRFDINGKKILFIHIPKTAGTFVEHFLCKLEGKSRASWPTLDKKALYGLYKKGGRRYILQHLTAHQIFEELCLARCSEFDFIFTVVRHPNTKVISEANWYNISPAKYLENLQCANSPHYYHQRDFIAGYESFVTVYRFELDIEKLLQDLCFITMSRCPSLCNIPRNVSAKRFFLDQLTHDDLEKIKKIFKCDFELFRYVTQINVALGKTR